MECIKLNYNKTKTVNMCKFPITLSYCLLHQDDQSIQVANSCYDGFVTETVYPGRAVSDESVDTRFLVLHANFQKPQKMPNLLTSIPHHRGVANNETLFVCMVFIMYNNASICLRRRRLGAIN